MAGEPAASQNKTLGHILRGFLISPRKEETSWEVSTLPVKGIHANQQRNDESLEADFGRRTFKGEREKIQLH